MHKLSGPRNFKSLFRAAIGFDFHYKFKGNTVSVLFEYFDSDARFLR